MYPTGVFFYNSSLLLLVDSGLKTWVTIPACGFTLHGVISAIPLIKAFPNVFSLVICRRLLDILVAWIPRSSQFLLYGWALNESFSDVLEFLHPEDYSSEL